VDVKNDLYVTQPRPACHIFTTNTAWSLPPRHSACSISQLQSWQLTKSHIVCTSKVTLLRCSPTPFPASMSSIGPALAKRPYDPPITTYNCPGSQDRERTDRRREECEPVSCHRQRHRASARQGTCGSTRLPQGIVKIITTPLHRNPGIRSPSLPSGDFEEQIRRNFRNNVRSITNN
jgi:hypothetical protein